MENSRKPVPMDGGYFILRDDWKNYAGAPYQLNEIKPFLPYPSPKRAKIGHYDDGQFVIEAEVLVWVGNKFSLGYCFPAQLPKVDEPISFDEAEEIFCCNPRLSAGGVEGARWVSPYDGGLSVPAKIKLDGEPCEFLEARRRIGPCSLNEVDGEIRWVSDFEPSVHIAAKLPALPVRDAVI